MNKHVILGVLGLAVTSVFTSCSKGSDLYDAGTVQQNQQEQKIAQLKQTYSDAFTKEFGTIASNNAWGFDRTTGSVAGTRTASVSETSVYWIIPENLWNGTTNKEGSCANDLANDFKTGGTPSYTVDNFSFDNYFIQHVDKQKGNEGKAIRNLQAWSSKDKEWQDVTNFAEGDNPNGDFSSSNFYFKNQPNSTADITTLMKDMGGKVCDKADEKGSNESIGKLFRLAMKDGSYDYNYTIRWVNNKHKKPKKSFNEPILVFKVGEFGNGKGKGNNPFWVMRLGVAKNTSDQVMAEGRILCEDMGANDFDFNDVVFDAQIMGNGVIKILVLAHGGMLDITIDDVKVTLPTMTNTGLADAEPQEIIIPALANGTPKYTTINAIPVKVVPNGGANDAYDLTAKVGDAPQKVCVPIGTNWPDEYVKLGRAYTPFNSYVSISNPEEWYFESNPDLMDLIMTNND